MPKIKYEPVKAFHDDTLRTIDNANKIINEYHDKGFDLTLRQLYYQFVARDLIANEQKEYNRLGRIVNDGRMCGLIDWYAIEDRTRTIRKRSHWNSPEEVIQSAHQSYHINLWANQGIYVEVWIEKDALVGVIDSVCRNLDVTFFSCRGYVSQSEMWQAGQRLKGKANQGKEIVILHLGDHDPSGIDMTRDITDRLMTFSNHPQASTFHPNFVDIDVRRIALNRDQIDEFEPPPNPAKVTDSRFEEYQKIYGKQSWELDALEPTVLEGLIRDEVESLRNEEAWQRRLDRLNEEKDGLKEIAENYDRIIDFLEP